MFLMSRQATHPSNSKNKLRTTYLQRLLKGFILAELFILNCLPEDTMENKIRKVSINRLEKQLVYDYLYLSQIKSIESEQR